MSTPSAVSLDALRPIRSVEGLAQLYGQLGYHVEAQLSALSGEQLGLPESLERQVKAATLLGAEVDATGTELQLWHFTLRQQPNADIIRRISENFMARLGHYLLSFSGPATAEAAPVTFVKPRSEVGVQKSSAASADALARPLVRLSKLTVNPAQPTMHDITVLRGIAAAPNIGVSEMHRTQIEAFSAERVTQRFFSVYARLFRQVMAVIRAENPGAAILSNPKRHVPREGEQNEEGERALHAFTQRLLGRLLFLYFIQKKGWLRGDDNFLTHLYRQTVAQGGNFYRDALEPLYFATLNAPESLRAAGQPSEAEIPYLNGSLFEREYPLGTVLNLPNSLFDPARGGEGGGGDPGGILHVLNSFNFTVSESGALEQEVSLDPEMLGKVFENLMEAEEAAESGTFYTPRSIVQFMAEETLSRYLADTTGLPHTQMLALMQEAGADTEAALPPLRLAQANAVRDALAAVRVLDPAVGTASMLVGFLNAMVRARRNVETLRGTRVEDGSPTLADWKRFYIQHCLYGVDIKHEAIEIARLRLWLSLVVDAKHPEPLPNLDYKLMAGDGLLETVDGSPFIKAERQFVGGQGDVSRMVDEIGRLHARFFAEQDPTERRELRTQLQHTERELFRADVQDRIKSLDDELITLNRKLADSHLSAAAKKKLLNRHAALQTNLEALMLQKRKVWDEGEPLPFFLHGVHFAEVMNRGTGAGEGGFDIVLGNPPYVSIGNMKPEYKAALKNAFPEVASGRADLYVYFFQKALQLLRNGGRLAFITPNKYMRAAYGKKLREVLSSKNRLELLADFGDLPVFDATTYPLITILQKAASDGEPVEMLPERTLKAHIGEGLSIHDTREQLASFHVYARDLMAPLDPNALTEAEWTLDNPEVLALMQKLREAGTPLGEVVEGKFYYGIKTGFNEAFVIDEAKRAELIAADPRSEEVIKPFLRGRDVRRWEVEWAGLYLLTINRGFELDAHPAIKAHLEQYREPLSNRATVGNHEWYELQQPQEAYQKEFEKDKVFWPHFAATPMFSRHVGKMFVNDKGYAMPQVFLGQLQLLNSRVIWAFMKCISPPVRGGYQENRIIYMEQLPIPTPTPEQAQRLAEFTDDSRLDELNALVYELYGLTEGEIALVERLTAGAYGE